MKNLIKLSNMPMLILLLSLAFQVNAQKRSILIRSQAPGTLSHARSMTPDTVSLPFNESWNQGTFAFNNWVHSGNWNVNTGIGNPAPSADYTGLPVHSNYNDTLQTVTFSATEFTCAAIYLDFDYKLLDLNHTGAEFLTVEKHVDSTWKTISEFNNNGDKPWTSMHLALNHAAGKTFTIRFRAHGSNSQDILHWFVDNISVYAVCRPPINLTFTESHYAVTLSWQPPDCNYNGPQSQWIHWDDGVNYDAIGTCNCESDIAMHWIPEQIVNLAGSSVTKISFFPCSSGVATYRARIWQGAGGSNLIVDQDIPAPTLGQWNIVDLAAPALIDVSQDLWIGLYIHFISGYPAGVDNGPAINGFGNMIYYSGTWVSLVSLDPALDYNWNIQAYVEALKSATKPVILREQPIPDLNGTISVKGHTPGSGIRFIPGESQNNPKGNSILMGYNIWRTDGTGDTTTFHKLNAAIVVDTTYTDNIYHDSLGIFRYQVTSVMNDSATNAFLCESPASNKLIVSVPAVGITETEEGSISVYPNPSNDIINIKSDFPFNSIVIIDCFGQTVFRNTNVCSKTTRLNIADLRAGIYFVKLTTTEGERIVKITVMR